MSKIPPNHPSPLRRVAITSELPSELQQLVGQISGETSVRFPTFGSPTNELSFRSPADESPFRSPADEDNRLTRFSDRRIAVEIFNND